MIVQPRDRSFSEPDLDGFLLPPSSETLKRIQADLTQFMQSENFEKVAGPRDEFRKKLAKIAEQSNFYGDPAYANLYSTLIREASNLDYISFTTRSVFFNPGGDQISIIHFLLQFDLPPAREERENKRQTGTGDQ